MMKILERNVLMNRIGIGFAFLLSFLSSTVLAFSPPVSQVINDLKINLYKGRTAQEISQLDNAGILAAMTPEQNTVLSGQYWVFDVNIPVIVSVVRDKAQPEPPFWLLESGFERTPLEVRNENYGYEVWRKSFPAGRIDLGINGFDCHRPHYFVGVGPQQPGDALVITPGIPEKQEIYAFALGSSIYHDWPELVLTQVPDEFKGHLLLPTIRGRAREAHLINAFRETPYPSSEKADLTTLTWSEDPRYSQTLQWRRRNAELNEVLYREINNDTPKEWKRLQAEYMKLEDQNIVNDPIVFWHRAVLAPLTPDTLYEYCIGSLSEVADAHRGRFKTAPEQNKPFSFLWLSDTHNRQDCVNLLETAWTRHPDAAFLTISGDLVGMGQHRDDWDEMLHYLGEFTKQKPLLPSIGNHDAIDGLGSDLYRSLLLLPDNGPKGLHQGQTYRLRYGNLLFISLDVTEEISVQTSWIEETLRDTDAVWKVAVLHFPPYSIEEDYPEIRREWGSLFDAYHVDIVLSGHVHHYQRTWPLNADKRVASPAEGTIYMISVAVEGPPAQAPAPEYAEVFDLGGKPTCQVFSMDGNQLVMHAYEADGTLRDSFTLKK